MGIFGFSTESSSGGDFLPVLRYDARAGRFFRDDRVDTGNGFVTEAVDVTTGFKAIFDLENVEVGWIKFARGSAPDFQLVPMGKNIGDRPSDLHKNGVRFMVKLAKDVGGDKPVREIAGTSRAFLSALEALYHDYESARAVNDGRLPVVTLEGTMPIKSGQGATQSTNYMPRFKIVGWTSRGDLVFVPKAPQAVNGKPVTSIGGPAALSSVAAVPNVPPSTGSTRVDPPKPVEPALVGADDDFG